VLDEILLTFSIMAAAARPLSEIEIGTVLGICRSRKDIKRSRDFEPFQNLTAVIEREVPHLVSLQDDGTITFVHLSFKDYIENQKRFKPIIETGRQSITKACLVYLKLQDLLQRAAVETEHDGMNYDHQFSSLQRWAC
jgi:hypothetical protein